MERALRTSFPAALPHCPQNMTKRATPVQRPYNRVQRLSVSNVQRLTIRRCTPRCPHGRRQMYVARRYTAVHHDMTVDIAVAAPRLEKQPAFTATLRKPTHATSTKEPSRRIRFCTLLPPSASRLPRSLLIPSRQGSHGSLPCLPRKGLGTAAGAEKCEPAARLARTTRVAHLGRALNHKCISGLLWPFLATCKRDRPWLAALNRHREAA
jgi:hypothetical protein